MTDGIRLIDVESLKQRLHDGCEIALLDAREEVSFGRRHLLMASCLPLSRLELRVDDLVPRRGARVVWCDDGEGLAHKSAARMAELGYSDVAVLDGGVTAWESAGYRVYSGVHVPSKAFAEVVEHEAGTPWIDVAELQRLVQEGADIAIFDSRSFAEYHSNSIPGAVSVPGAELVYRFRDLVPSAETMVVVNCGGRTRSIIGAQSLINAGAPNRIVSLKDGTMAWHLAGHEVVRGADRRPPPASAEGAAAARHAIARIAERQDIRAIDRAQLQAWRTDRTRTLYVIDVRNMEEYEAGHLPGARPVAGGQLVQETDNHLGTWGARVVLVDDDGVRAVMTASWLKQMGWTDVATLQMASDVDGLVVGPYRPAVLGLDAADVPQLDVAQLRADIDSGRALVIDLASSRDYRTGHIPGAWFAIRARLAEALGGLPRSQRIVLTSPDGTLARLAAADLARIADVPVAVLKGGTSAWTAAGEPLEDGAVLMASAADDVWLPARERGGDREKAMREYLAWEIDLVNQMASDDDQRFSVLTL